MDTSDRILNCDATSLLNLKAELYKKQEACKLARTHQTFVPRKGMTVKGQEITSKKKDKTVPESTEVSGDNYEDEMLHKSRMMLEAKTKMYEQIIEKKVILDEEFSDSYLVDFQRKEFFGHSPDIHKSDLKPDHVADISSSEKVTVDSDNQVSSKSLTSPVSASHQSVDSQLWSSHSSSPNPVEETKTTAYQNSDGPVHYQNVQFSEIRDHGVGYFAFSQEEKERQEQMELLKNLRQETVESKQASEKLKQKKQALLQSRLAKVCQRRNIDSSVLQACTTKQEETEDISDGMGLEQGSGNPTDKPKNTEPDAKVSSKKIRPWDMGKSNFDFPVQIPKKKQSGTEKWIEHKRAERNEEFAPPSFYNTEPETKKFCPDH